MTCSESEDLILDQVDGRLAGDGALLLREHLTGCPACREFFAEQSEIDRALWAAAQAARLRTAGAGRRRPAQAWTPAPRYRLGFLLDLAGVASVAVASGFAAAYFLPHLMAGAPWVAAGVVLCGGVWITLAEPSTPSA